MRRMRVEPVVPVELAWREGRDSRRKLARHRIPGALIPMLKTEVRQADEELFGVEVICRAVERTWYQTPRDGTRYAALAEQITPMASSLQRALFSFTLWVGPFEVAEMGQKYVGLDT